MSANLGRCSTNISARVVTDMGIECQLTIDRLSVNTIDRLSTERQSIVSTESQLTDTLNKHDPAHLHVTFILDLGSWLPDSSSMD